MVIGALNVPQRTVRRDFLTALAVPIITAVLLIDSGPSRIDGLLICASGVIALALTRLACDCTRCTKPGSAQHQLGVDPEG
jgi:hypothetical protein